MKSERIENRKETLEEFLKRNGKIEKIKEGQQGGMEQEKFERERIKIDKEMIVKLKCGCEKKVRSYRGGKIFGDLICSNCRSKDIDQKLLDLKSQIRARTSDEMLAIYSDQKICRIPEAKPKTGNQNLKLDNDHSSRLELRLKL